MWKLCKKDIFCLWSKIGQHKQEPSTNLENLYNNFKWVICDKNKTLHFNLTICENVDNR